LKPEASGRKECCTKWQASWQRVCAVGKFQANQSLPFSVTGICAYRLYPERAVHAALSFLFFPVQINIPFFCSADSLSSFTAEPGLVERLFTHSSSNKQL
jgi:hypothetical protein